MYLNTGYLNHSHMDFKDKSRPLIVGSCGTYRLSRHPKLPTYRPKGRLEYQIIYITAASAHLPLPDFPFLTDPSAQYHAGPVFRYTVLHFPLYPAL